MKKEIKHDMAIAGRFKFFRKKFIDNHSRLAGEKLGIAQSRISGIENGINPVSAPLIKIMQNKFHLNRDWLLDNVGDPQKKDVKPKPTALFLTELDSKITELSTEVLVLSKNLDRAWQIIEQQGKLIEQLRNKK